MKKVSIRIEGISPLLMHRFPLTEKDEKSKIKNQKKNMDDVEGSLYRDDQGKLVQPSSHLIGTLKKAGAKYQIPGQGKLTYKNLMGSGAVIIEQDMIEHEIQTWDVDRRPVVVQRARIIRSRPILKEWALSFNVEFDEDEVPKEVLKELFDYAGRRVGIGDYRPGLGGPFGRFIVTSFN